MLNALNKILINPVNIGVYRLQIKAYTPSISHTTLAAP